MMAIIVGSFAICWIPFAVMFMLIPTCETTAQFFFEYHPSAIEWITWIGKIASIVDTFEVYNFITHINSGYVNSSLNPIIYVFMNPGFRNAITKVFNRKN